MELPLRSRQTRFRNEVHGKETYSDGAAGMEAVLLTAVIQTDRVLLILTLLPQISCCRGDRISQVCLDDLVHGDRTQKVMRMKAE